MKKLLLSAGVILAFLFNSISQRLGQNTSSNSVSLAPLPNSNSTSSGLTPSSILVNPTGSSGAYKDGTYTGSTADAFYGNVQVQATVQGGRVTGVSFLQYPSDRMRSMMINQMAMPVLQAEAIKAQSGQVDIVSGATDTSSAFIQSLQSALSQAQ